MQPDAAIVNAGVNNKGKRIGESQGTEQKEGETGMRKDKSIASVMLGVCMMLGGFCAA